MDIIELVKAAVFGIVEGITEWLPISSTGHMLLLNQFPHDERLRGLLEHVPRGHPARRHPRRVRDHVLPPAEPVLAEQDRGEKRDTWLLWAKTVVACLPAAVIGIPIDDWMEANLGSPFVIAAALIVYGIAFIVIETVRERRADRALAEEARGQALCRAAARPRPLALRSSPTPTPRVQSLEELDWKTAIGIGLFQVLSIVPGTSRLAPRSSAASSSAAKRTVVAEFTFFLAIPVMVGASGLRLVKFFLAGNVPTSMELAVLGVGCLVAFVVSLAAIKVPDGLRPPSRLQAVRLVPHRARRRRHRLVCAALGRSHETPSLPSRPRRRGAARRPARRRCPGPAVALADDVAQA